ncbi:MAG: hypothetical protein K2Q01_08530 [Rickettsiales bacterium]|nr:hypothetical protein [Rickettsiales bacterium]
MTNDSINRWVKNAKNEPAQADAPKEVNVVRRAVAPSKGQIIMDIADKLWPGLVELLRDVRDNSGMLLQPAHIRGIALTMAQDLASRSEKNRPTS